MNVRLNNHVVIDKKTAQKLFSIYNPKAEVVHLQLIPEGMSTSNYIIHLQNTPLKYLLKIYPENGGNSAVEVASYQYAKQYVNVPQIHLFNRNKKVFYRPYLIMDYVDGMSLSAYVNHHRRFPDKIAYNIGSKLALLHHREYETMALLNENLDIQKALLPIAILHEYYLNGIAGSHISSAVKDDVLKFISANKEMLKRLELIFVFSHGDFGPQNILIDNQDNVWFIDFEYSLAAPIYYDIGKFFRSRESMNPYMVPSTYENFISGYNAVAKHPVPDDWIKLALLIDITSMLALINKAKIPDGWAEEIEEEIIQTMRILKMK
jgi:tRNA A-37 threonylcarbamoyl transferase component Bud32